MSNAIITCVLGFVADLEREANLRPQTIALDERVFDLLAQEVLALDTVGIKTLGLAPSAKFSIVRHVLPRCESVTLHGVRVVRHSGGHDGRRP